MEKSDKELSTPKKREKKLKAYYKKLPLFKVKDILLGIKRKSQIYKDMGQKVPKNLISIQRSLYYIIKNKEEEQMEKAKQTANTVNESIKLAGLARGFIKQGTLEYRDDYNNLKLVEQLLNEFGKGTPYSYKTKSQVCGTEDAYSFYSFSTDGKETDGVIYNFSVSLRNEETNVINVSFSTHEKAMDALNVGLKELIKIMSTVAIICKDHIVNCKQKGNLIDTIEFFPVRKESEWGKGFSHEPAREKIYKRVILQHIPNAKFRKLGGTVYATFDPNEL